MKWEQAANKPGLTDFKANLPANDGYFAIGLKIDILSNGNSNTPEAKH
jgi:hypothetical protein